MPNRASLEERDVKLYLIAMSVVSALLGIASIIPAFFSVMVIGAPGAISNPATVVLFLSVFTCPVVAYSSIAGAWMLFSSARRQLAGFVILAPAFNLAAFAISLYVLKTFYGGKFNG